MINTKLIKNIVFFSLILLFIYLLNTYGSYTILIFLGFTLLFGLYKLWVHRSLFMSNLRILESKIWGKPLDREAWNKDEIKRLKVKVVWKK